MQKSKQRTHVTSGDLDVQHEVMVGEGGVKDKVF